MKRIKALSILAVFLTVTVFIISPAKLKADELSDDIPVVEPSTQQAGEGEVFPPGQTTELTGNQVDDIVTPQPTQPTQEPIENGSNCGTISVESFHATNWPQNARLSIWCAGLTHGETYTDPDTNKRITSLGTCPGDYNKTIAPGERQFVSGCHCLRDDTTGRCLQIGQLPPGCTLSNNDFCGAANGQTIFRDISVTCQPPPGRGGPQATAGPPGGPPGPPVGPQNTPVPPGPGAPPRVCECQYNQECTAPSGRAGHMTCSGVKNTSEVCVFDTSNSCIPNCSVVCQENAEVPTPIPGAPPPIGTPPIGGPPPGFPPPEAPPPEFPPPGFPPGTSPPPGFVTPPLFATATPGPGTPTAVPPSSTPTPGPGTPTAVPPSPTPGPGTPSVTPNLTPTPTPKPPFDTSMCHCNGINPSGIFQGQPGEFTAFAKVTGVDKSVAKVQALTFFAAKDSTVIAKSDPITPTKVDRIEGSSGVPSCGPPDDCFKATWRFTFPEPVSNTATYRVWAQITCNKKTTALIFVPQNVLAAQTQASPSLLQNIFNFIGGLFGKTNQSPAPAASTLTNSAPKSLQLKPFKPAQILDKTCRFLMFRFPKQE